MMNKTGISKADDIRQVERLRNQQDMVQADQERQSLAVQAFAAGMSRLESMGTDDTYVEIATHANDVGYNAMNLARETEARAMEIVNEDLGKARIADDYTKKAERNAQVVSNVGDAVNDIHSGREAREVEISIQRAGEHQKGVSAATTRNASELQQNTNQAVQVAHSTASRIRNILPQ